MSTALDGVGDQRHERCSSPSSSTSHDGPAMTRSTVPSPSTAAADQVVGEPLVLLERCASTQQLLAAAARAAASRSSTPSRPDERPLVGAVAARTTRRSRPATLRPSSPSCSWLGRVDVEAAVEAVGPADARRRHERSAVNRRRRRARGGPCGARRAFTTVRSALIVRPPRPITLPTSSSRHAQLEHEGAVVLLERLDRDRVGSSTRARARYARRSSIGLARGLAGLAPSRLASASSRCSSAERRARASAGGARRRATISDGSVCGVVVPDRLDRRARRAAERWSATTTRQTGFFEPTRASRYSYGHEAGE